MPRRSEWLPNGCTEVQENMANSNRIKRLAPGFPAAQGNLACPPPPAEQGRAAFFSLAPTHEASRPFYFDAPEFGFIDQLLDIGGGSGQVASLLKHRQPQLKVTIFDFAPVCDQALDWFYAHDQSEDLGAHSGDFFLDPLPSGFPAAQFSHVLELFPSEKILWLLKKAFDALPRGGKLFIYGYACNDEKLPIRDLSWCLPAFTLFMTGAGRLYAVSQYLRWLRVVGFSRISYRHDGGRTLFLMAIK